MRLCEHPDFEQAILQVADHYRDRGLRPAIVEKDYFVTEALRCIAAAAGDRVIFKGGTSLSKGWNLIQRFSEDIDIFLDTDGMGKNAIDRELKKLRDAVGKHPALSHLPEESKTIGGFGRNDYFSFPQQFGGVGDVRNRVLLESGTASGRQPVANIELSSYVGDYLRDRGISLGAIDEQPFSMRLLHFRRTFVEKLFAIHGKVEGGRPLGTYARHYYDLFKLSLREEVLHMVQSAEFAEIKADYDRVSRASFPNSYTPPDGLSFRHSRALFPDKALEHAIQREFEKQCKLLCFGNAPSWKDVRARFELMRDWL